MCNFSSRLKSLREEKNISQKQLADVFDFSRSTITNYEKNNRLPDIETLCQLADYFNVSTDYLLCRTNARKNLYRHVPLDDSIITFIVDPDDGSFVDCSLSAVEFFGYSKDLLLSMKVYETTLSSKEDIMTNIKETLQERQKIFVSQHITADGIVKDVQITINPLEVEGRTLLYCVINDLSSYAHENRLLSNTIKDLIETMSDVYSSKLYYKKNHAKRVAEVAVAIGEKMGLSRERIFMLKITGLFHDLGEIYLPGDIMNKPDRLSVLEYQLIQKHPEYGYNSLKNIKYLEPAAKAILQHHERLDGSGYPARLKSNQILLEAKIIAVADIIEALTSERPHRPALKEISAVQFLSNQKDIKYDSFVVDTCIELMQNKIIRLRS